MRPAAYLLVRAFSAAPLLALTSCAELLDVPDDPELARGPWSCLDNPVGPSAPEADTAIVRVQACNFISTNCAEPATGISAKLCDKKDVTCANPIEPSITDAGGALVFEVATGGVLGVGFDGYLGIVPPLANCTNQEVFGEAGPLLCALSGCDPAAPDERCNVPLYAPTFMFFNPAIKSDVSRPIPLPLVPTSAVPTLIGAAGGTFNPTTGIVFITALDCNGTPAPDVSFTVDKYQDRVTELYLDKGVVSNAVTQTDSSGIGGFIGVPSGFIGVEGFTGETEGTTRSIGKLGVQVTSFTISYSTMVPSL